MPKTKHRPPMLNPSRLAIGLLTIAIILSGCYLLLKLVFFVQTELDMQQIREAFAEQCPNHNIVPDKSGYDDDPAAAWYNSAGSCMLAFSDEFECDCFDTDSNASAEYLLTQPAPRPDFIVGNSSSDEAVYVQISQRPLWTGGYNKGELFRHISEHILISFNNNILEHDKIFMAVDLMNYPVRDDNGNIIGSYGGMISVYIKTQNLPRGLYIANLAFTDLAGNPFSYTWAFER